MTATSNRPSPASSPALLGALVGLVLLGALVAFAVLLPRAGETSDGSTSDTPPGGPTATDAAGETSSDPLPETLPGGLTATDVVDETQVDADAAEEFAGLQADLVASAQVRLEELYDAPAHVRTYRDPERGIQVTVMVVDQAAGPFVPDGPPVDPSLLGYARNLTDLVNVGDGTCSLIWQEPVPAGEPVTVPDPQALKCQVGGAESTYQLIGVGITAEEAVELLDGLAA